VVVVDGIRWASGLPLVSVAPNAAPVSLPVQL
jgi:hypothetical protein